MMLADDLEPHTLDFLNSCLRYTARPAKQLDNVIHFIFQCSSKQVSLSVNVAFVNPQVKTLKERIEQEKGKDSFSVAGQKLIYAGMLHVLTIKTTLVFVDSFAQFNVVLFCQNKESKSKHVSLKF